MSQSEGPECPANSIPNTGSNFHSSGVLIMAATNTITNPPTMEIIKYATCRFQLTKPLYLRQLLHQQKVQHPEPKRSYHRERHYVSLIGAERFHTAQVLRLERQEDQDGGERSEQSRTWIEAVLGKQ